MRANDYHTEQVKAIKKMFAAKLLTHARDYALGVKRASERKNKKGETIHEKELSLNARRAVSWMWAESTEPASFIWICDLLEMDADKVRMKIIHGWRAILGIDNTGRKWKPTEDTDEDV